MDTDKMKSVFTIVEKPNGKSYFVRIGIGFVNRDGSITLKLDALPVNNTIQVRDWENEEERARRVAARRAAGEAQAPALG